jgi:Flp pilus assembly protein TadG
MPPKNTAGMVRTRLQSEAGVSLISVAISILVLTSFLAFVLDYGVMWLARRQAQNAADSGALAGATARAYDETDDPPADDGIAHDAAFAAAQQNLVFGEAGGVAINWDCPAFAAGGKCVRVDVHRDGTLDSNPLPTFFAGLLGVTSQNVRATATAWVAYGNTTNCMRPFSVADNWIDNVTSTPRKFQRWNKVGPNAVEMSPKDVYVPQFVGGTGTGYTPDANLGDQVFLKKGNPAQTADDVEPGWSLPVRLPDGAGGYTSGADDFSDAIKQCIGNPVSVGDYLPLETGVMTGPTAQGVSTDADSLVNQDKFAVWNTSTKTVDGSCAPGCASFSPRIVPIATFDMDEFQWRSSANNWTTPWIPGVGPGTGSTFNCPAGGRCVRVTNIIGFFVEGLTSGDVTGRVVMYPGEFVSGPPSVNSGAGFLTDIQLIR